MIDQQTTPASKAALTKGPEEHHRAARMARWTMRFGKNDRTNPYALENYYPYVSRLGGSVPPYHIVTWDNKTTADRSWADDMQQQFQRQGFVNRHWSVGNTRKIRNGDRLVLLAQYQVPRGVVALGRVTREPYDAAHWLEARAARGDMATYVDATWDYFGPDPIIPEGSLPPEFDDLVPWKSRRGGIELKLIGPYLEQEVWRRAGLDDGERSPDELDSSVVEGARKTVQINAFERNGKARRACLAAHGYACAACGHELADLYGATPKASSMCIIWSRLPASGNAIA